MHRIFLTSLNKFYVTVGFSALILMIFLILAVSLIKLLLSGQESRLQKEYGTDADRRRQQKRKASITRLVILGIVLVCLVAVYIFVL